MTSHSQMFFKIVLIIHVRQIPIAPLQELKTTTWWFSNEENFSIFCCGVPKLKPKKMLGDLIWTFLNNIFLNMVLGWGGCQKCGNYKCFVLLRGTFLTFAISMVRWGMGRNHFMTLLFSQFMCYVFYFLPWQFAVKSLVGDLLYFSQST